MVIGIVLLIAGVVSGFYGLNLVLGPTPKWSEGSKEDGEALAGGAIAFFFIGIILAICGLIQIVNHYPK